MYVTSSSFQERMYFAIVSQLRLVPVTLYSHDLNNSCNKTVKYETLFHDFPRSTSLAICPRRVLAQTVKTRGGTLELSSVFFSEF